MKNRKGEPVNIQLSEDVSFLNKASIMRTLNELPDDVHVIIDKTKTKSIHPDVVEIIDDFIQNGKTRGITVEFKSAPRESVVNPVAQFGKVVLDK